MKGRLLPLQFAENGSVNPAQIINQFENKEEQTMAASLFSTEFREEMDEEPAPRPERTRRELPRIHLTVPPVLTKLAKLYFPTQEEINARRESADGRRRRKPSKQQIFKEFYLPAIILGLAVVLILSFVIGSIANAIDQAQQERLAKEQQAQAESLAAEQMETEGKLLIDRADKAAMGYDYDEAKKGIEFAKNESATGKIVIEKYMGQNNDFSMTIIVVNGKAYPFRTVDRILGKYEDGLDKLAVGAVMPSVFTDLYMKNVHHKVEALIKDIGLINAPVFMQGFVDNDTVRFYDPGLRFPGGEYERMFKYAMGKDLFYPLIEYVLTGEVSADTIDLSDGDILLNGKIAVQVLPTLCAGKIGSIIGIDDIKDHSNVVSVFEKYSVGDEIKETHNVNQRFCEIDVVCDDAAQMRDTVAWIYETLKIFDENGNNMIVSSYDPNLFLQRVIQ